MDHEEEIYRRRQYELRMQEDRRRNRDGGHDEINDFRSRWEEPSSDYLHQRERNWTYDDRDVPYEREQYNNSRRQQRAADDERRDEHLFNQQHEYRSRGDRDGFSNANQHANDRWEEDNYMRYLQERQRYDRRRRSSRDDW